MFAENLKNFRRKNNYTQQQLADAIFVSRTLITKYESGAVTPTKENVKKIAEVLKCEPTDLLSYDEACNIVSKYSKRNFVINISLSLTAIILNLIWDIIIWLPIFSKYIYVYPIPEGQTAPDRVKVYFSLMGETLKNNSPFTLLSFIFSFLTITAIITQIFLANKKAKKITQIVSLVLVLITLVLIIFSPSGYINRNL